MVGFHAHRSIAPHASTHTMASGCYRDVVLSTPAKPTPTPRPSESKAATISWKSIVESSPKTTKHAAKETPMVTKKNASKRSNGDDKDARIKIVRSRSISRIVEHRKLPNSMEPVVDNDLCEEKEKPASIVFVPPTDDLDGRERKSVDNGSPADCTITVPQVSTRRRSASADSVLLRRCPFPQWSNGACTDETKVRNDACPSKCATAEESVRCPSQLCRTKSFPSRNELVTAEMSALGDRSWMKEQSTVRDEEALEMIVSTDEDLSELDCDDVHSETTSDSFSCPSPRHSPVRSCAASDADVSLLDVNESQEDHLFGDEDEKDLEALLLLDRINHLSAEFKAHREYEETNALTWAVQHAARQGIISAQLQQSLHAIIQNGSYEEARDVLYHKCHLIPAVRSVVEDTVSSPSAENTATNDAFLSCVDALSPTETSDERMHKLKVLKMLSDVLTRWVKVVGYERGLTEEHVALTGGSLYLAGSYRLGLNDPHSDIDAVCVVPWHITHEDFFGSFCNMLAKTNGVCQLAPVPNAYVPLISLSLHGVNLDLLLARLPMSCVESNQEIDSDHILAGVDASSMKSLNAPRVSSMLLCLVPKRRVFRVVLRAVRAWARRRGIYSSKLGYLGGISWAILVAFVCQMYPNATPSDVFVKFFQVLSEWRWPQPVMLNMVYDAGLGFEMWDPRQNMYDRAHIMPIITPAYPHMNSAVQVSQSTFSVIYEELWRARYLAEMMTSVPPSIASSAATKCETTALSITTNEVNDQSENRWAKLFQPSNFFIRYDSYLIATYRANTTAALHVWGKFVQSRLRKLVDSLQHVSCVSKVHAFPQYFSTTDDRPGSCMFIGIEFHARPTNTAAMEDAEVRDNLERTIRFFAATDLQQFAGKQPGMDADACLLRWDELPSFVFPHDRAQALVERTKYRQDLEQMTMAQKFGGHRSPSSQYTNYGRGNRYRHGNHTNSHSPSNGYRRFPHQNYQHRVPRQQQSYGRSAQAG